MCYYVLKQSLLFVFGLNARLKPTDPIGYEGEVMVKAASHSLCSRANTMLSHMTVYGLVFISEGDIPSLEHQQIS